MLTEFLVARADAAQSGSPDKPKPAPRRAAKGKRR
jgi:hypothetical protein